MSHGHFNYNNPNQNNMGFSGNQPRDLQNLYFANNTNASFNFYVGSASHPPPPENPYPTGTGYQQDSVMEMSNNRNASNCLHQMFPSSDQGCLNHGYHPRGATNIRLNLDTSGLAGQQQRIVFVVPPPESSFGHQVQESGCPYHPTQRQQITFCPQGPSTAQVGNANPPMLLPRASSSSDNDFVIRPASNFSGTSFSTGSGSSLSPHEMNCARAGDSTAGWYLNPR